MYTKGHILKKPENNFLTNMCKKMAFLGIKTFYKCHFVHDAQKNTKKSLKFL